MPAIYANDPRNSKRRRKAVCAHPGPCVCPTARAADAPAFDTYPPVGPLHLSKEAGETYIAYENAKANTNTPTTEEGECTHSPSNT